ncbi:hypothetical protein W02_39000 [Nitrospira sp. KM1]|nr:hypothetical protein W02_39000 [Nitrospira sp. KM1]
MPQTVHEFIRGTNLFHISTTRRHRSFRLEQKLTVFMLLKRVFHLVTSDDAQAKYSSYARTVKETADRRMVVLDQTEKGGNTNGSKYYCL